MLQVKVRGEQKVVTCDELDRDITFMTEHVSKKGNFDSRGWRQWKSCGA